jgi:hypothetical protein
MVENPSDPVQSKQGNYRQCKSAALARLMMRGVLRCGVEKEEEAAASPVVVAVQSSGCQARCTAGDQSAVGNLGLCTGSHQLANLVGHTTTLSEIDTNNRNLAQTLNTYAEGVFTQSSMLLLGMSSAWRWRASQRLSIFQRMQQLVGRQEHLLSPAQ